MRRSEHNGKPLLSQAGGRNVKKRAGSVTDAFSSSSDDPLSTDITPAKRRKKEKFEPATDDDPISSSCESDTLSRISNASETGNRRRKQPISARVDLEATPKPRRTAVAPSPNTATRKSQRLSSVDKTPVVKKDIVAWSSAKRDSGPDFLFGREPRKRARAVTYGGKYSLGNKQSQLNFPKSSPKVEERFIVPREVQVPGSPDSQLGQTTSTGFKVPISIPNDAFSNSSLPTTYSREVAQPLSLEDRSGSSSPLSSVAPSDMDLTADEKRYLDAQDFIRCEMCRELLDPDFVKDFKIDQGQSIKQKIQSCQQHKQWAAERDWRNANYPSIDWDMLEKRVKSHFIELDDILKREKASYFRTSLENQSDGNRKRDNFRLTAGTHFENMSSGYYGPRGSKLMMDVIISEFASQIRYLAPSDSLMKAAGVSGFVQAVLVPELTMILVKEDMGVGDERAREIMKESNKIGQLLNEQPDDDVQYEEESWDLR